MSKAAAAPALPGAAPEGIQRFVKIKTIVGDEVQPTFGDALALRKEVFMIEQGVSLEREVDGLDAVSLHLVAYIDLNAQKAYQEQQKVLERLTASSGLAVKFKHPSATEIANMKGEPPVRYRPPPLEPAGTVRMRRVSACSQLGKFNMMVCKIERLCVRKKFRGCGIGDLLLQAVEKTAREALHVPWVMMHAQVHAKSFYLRRGYVVWSDKQFLDANIPHIVMVKDLSTDGRSGVTSLAGTVKMECCEDGNTPPTANAAGTAAAPGALSKL